MDFKNKYIDTQKILKEKMNKNNIYNLLRKNDVSIENLNKQTAIDLLIKTSNPNPCLRDKKKQLFKIEKIKKFSNESIIKKLEEKVKYDSPLKENKMTKIKKKIYNQKNFIRKEKENLTKDNNNNINNKLKFEIINNEKSDYEFFESFDIFKQIKQEEEFDVSVFFG
jgi:hypothetical protein